ncbi:DNA cytosine methyltransferase [Dongia sp.]|uniref:DNA cytosine methyltransferase n=1 Tax=Dongia sp. TaxID=1977262 RepID=UPI0035B2CAFA
MLQPDELVVDNFAGGGGASYGIGEAIGRDPDIALNHDADACAMYSVNHPSTRVYCQSVWKADPRDVVADANGKARPVGLAWFSPDCKHFSKAKGGKPVEKHIRDLAWVVVHWAKLVKPRVIMLENVEEFRDWGPLITVADGKLMPCPERKGFTFRRWVKELRKLGYVVEWDDLRACDYGAPTIRKRLFLVARCDGKPIEWPAATHGPKGSGLRPYRTAAECIDWSIPCPSIFGRKKPLAENTLKRIARGIKRYVLDAAEPFIVPVTHHGDERCHSANEPLRTITTAKRGEMALVTPTLIQTGYGEREGQAPRALDIEKPLGTIVAGGVKHALVVPTLVGCGGRAAQSRPRSGDEPLHTITSKADTCIVATHITKFRSGAVGHGMDEPMHTVTANSYIKRPGGAAPIGLVSAFLAQHNAGPRNDNLSGRPVDKPVSTITQTGAQQGLVTAILSHQYSSNLAGGEGDLRKPMKTITAGGQHHALVQAFLIKYFSSAVGQDIKEPMHTTTAKARFGLVVIQGEEYEIVDIGMRMLQPRELFRAQSFPDCYIIDHGPDGKAITKTAQIGRCGNSVPPVMSTALVCANFHLPLPARIAA